MQNKVLVVCDVDWWAFEKIYQGLKSKCSDKWIIESCYLRKSPIIKHEDYDIILFLCDYMFNSIFVNKIPKEKLIFAVRQTKSVDLFINNNIFDYANIVAVSNKLLYSQYSNKYINIRLAPGGVNIDKFYYKKHEFKENIRVGWSGSIRNFGKDMRGISIIEKVCQDIGFIFCPAIREERMRTENEMVEYYHNDIDIYVDLSKSAGRQNGLIEAGACGLPIISSKVGIAEELIIDGENGFLCDRDENSLKDKLLNTIKHYDIFSINIRKTIEEKWSWDIHAKIFEEIFEEILIKGSK